MKYKFIFIALALSLFVACGMDDSGVQSVEVSADTGVVADVIELENGDYLVEGDMLFSPEGLVSSGVLKKSYEQSALLGSGISKWGANATIEYYYVPANASQNIVSMPAKAKRNFERALKDLSNGVALSFKEVTTPTTHTLYVYTYSTDIPDCVGASGCAYTGKVSAIGKKNIINFTTKTGLFYHTFFHEMTHVLGFQHEHQRADRDSSLIVNYDESDPSDVVNYGILDGDDLDTYFDMASIMLYSNVTPKNNIPAYLWRGVLPLQSNSDLMARQKIFGSEIAVQNLFYIKHTAGKYLCRSGAGSSASLVLNSTTSSNCLWDISSGSLALQQNSANNGIVLDHNIASTIRSTEKTRQGFGIYLTYISSSNKLSLTQGSGVRYSSKWIPMSNNADILYIWNPNGYCLIVKNNQLVTTSCPESEVRGNGPNPRFFSYGNSTHNWDLIPTWNTKTAF